MDGDLVREILKYVFYPPVLTGILFQIIAIAISRLLGGDIAIFLKLNKAEEKRLKIFIVKFLAAIYVIFLCMDFHIKISQHPMKY